MCCITSSIMHPSIHSHGIKGLCGLNDPRGNENRTNPAFLLSIPFSVNVDFKSLLFDFASGFDLRMLVNFQGESKYSIRIRFVQGTNQPPLL